MIDRYLNHMNNMISPKTHSTTSILKKANDTKYTECQVLNTTGSTNLLNGIANKNDHKGKIPDQLLKEIQQQFLMQKRENMFLRQENLEHKRLIEYLKQSNTILQNENNKLSTQAAKDREYLIKLEQILLMSKIKIDKSKREKYFSTSGTARINTDHIAKIQAENDQLTKFKKEVYRISNDYEVINTTIFALISNIRNLFEELNRKCGDDEEVNEQGEGREDGKEAEYSLGNVKDDIEQVFDLMIKSLNIKQDEYKYLLNEKEIALVELNEANTLLSKEKNSLIEDNLGKESLIDDLKNEIFIMKERKEKNNSTNQSNNNTYNKSNKNKKMISTSFSEYKTQRFDTKVYSNKNSNNNKLFSD